MELQDFRELVAQESSNTLRLPSPMLNSSGEDIKEKFKLTTLIKEMMATTFVEEEKNKLSRIRCKLEKQNNLTGNGTFQKPYHIQTNFGEGEFFNFYRYFKNGRIPSFFRKQECHYNCYEFALRQKRKSSILSGICCRNNPFLHSVLLIDDYILDFNLDLVMSKDLYINLFNFEILNTVDSEDIKMDAYKFYSGSKFFKENKITYGDVNFCYYEILDIINEEKSLNLWLEL